MKIIQYPINKIKRDTNQPRTVFSPTKISEMSKSILTEGIINPIEIDKDGVIVTGEIRWRAAKEAGFKTVPVKIIDPGGFRFRRQVIENVHHNTMSSMDTARAFKKLLGLRTADEVTQGKDAGISKLAREIGKGEKFIRDHLSLLNESEEVVEWLEKPDSPYSLIREANKFVPEMFRDKVKKKIITNKIDRNRAVVQIGKALQRSPEKSEELLSLDFSKIRKEKKKKKEPFTDADIAPVIEKIAPIKESGDKIAKRIISNIRYIDNHLNDSVLKRISRIDSLLLKRFLGRLKELLETTTAREGKIIDN